MDDSWVGVVWRISTRLGFRKGGIRKSSRKGERVVAVYGVACLNVEL